MKKSLQTLAIVRVRKLGSCFNIRNDSVMFYALDVSLVKRSLSEKKAKKKTSDKRTCVPRFDLVSNEKTAA